MVTQVLEPGVVAPDAGMFERLLKLGVRHLIDGEQTAGRLAIVEHPLPPHALGAPMHTHSREDEITYVAEGTIGVQIGGRVYVAGPGATIRKPRGIPHAFWNAGDTPARVSEVITPAGFEKYFPEIAHALAAGEDGGPDWKLAAEIAGRYGLVLDFDSIPILVKRHGLQ